MKEASSRLSSYHHVPSHPRVTVKCGPDKIKPDRCVVCPTSHFSLLLPSPAPSRGRRDRQLRESYLWPGKWGEIVRCLRCRDVIFFTREKVALFTPEKVVCFRRVSDVSDVAEGSPVWVSEQVSDECMSSTNLTIFEKKTLKFVTNLTMYNGQYSYPRNMIENESVSYMSMGREMTVVGGCN